MFKVFTYGTLRDPLLLTRVIGRRYELQEDDKYTRAILPGYTKINLFGLDWIIQDEDSHVRGLVIHGLNKVDMAGIDRFESLHTGLYVRRDVSVWSYPDQAMIDVVAYVPGPRFWNSLETQ